MTTFIEEIIAMHDESRGSKTIIGIDPGADGYIAVMRNGEIEYESLKKSSELWIAKFLGKYKDEECIAVMEDVHAIFGASAKSTFSFGQNKGFLIGVLTAHGIPYELVSPKVWQNEIWTMRDRIFKVRNGKEVLNTKLTSARAAERLFPNEDLRKTQACRILHDGKVDALLIAEYGRRKNV